MTQAETNDATEILQRLQDQHDAEQFLYEYQWLVDTKDLAGLARIIHPDVELSRRDGTRVGAEPFLDLYRDFAASDIIGAHHYGTNVHVTRLPDDRLRVRSRFLAITTHESGQARATWGHYVDDLVRHEGRWVYAAKRIHVDRTAILPGNFLAPVDGDSFATDLADQP